MLEPLRLEWGPSLSILAWSELCRPIQLDGYPRNQHGAYPLMHIESGAELVWFHRAQRPNLIQERDHVFPR